MESNSNTTQATSQKLHDEFGKFLEYAPPHRLSTNLRNLLLWYLIHAEGEYFSGFDDLLEDLTYLFYLLDVAEHEYQPGAWSPGAQLV